MREEVIFDTIQEAKEGYLVDYKPMYDSNLATLRLSFMEKTSKEKMIEVMEKELVCWIGKYPIRTMVCACDETGSNVYVKGVYDSQLTGWIDPETKQLKTSWNLDDSEGYDGRQEDFKEGWDKVYLNVDFRTKAQIKENAVAQVKQRCKEMRSFRLVMFLWFCIIPATWLSIQQFGHEWVGWAVYIYACAKILIEAKKIYFPKDRSETPEEIEKREMAHHHYHCKLNPEGFARLKSENFKRELREKVSKEYADLKNENKPTVQTGSHDNN
ncbi:MAG: hypothetical protein FWF24_02650 [Alphaproteobacteria bacterium]|nr:hypothetical protein [Alphaproteobacteria bacterium]